MTLAVSGHSNYVTIKTLLKRTGYPGKNKGSDQKVGKQSGHECENTTKLKATLCDYLTQGLKTITLLFWMTLIIMNTVCPLDCERVTQRGLFLIKTLNLPHLLL